MAYVSRETKQKIATALKAAKLPLNIKYTLAVRHHSSLVLTIREAPASVLDDYLDGIKPCDAEYRIENAKAVRANFEAGNLSVNEYHVASMFKGETLELLNALLLTIKEAGEWFDKSDSTTDYFHTAFYINVQFGSYDKPCVFTGERKKVEVVEDKIVAEHAPKAALPTAVTTEELIRRIALSMMKTDIGMSLTHPALEKLAAAALQVCTD